MSYTLAFYTVPVDELTARLTAQDASSDPEIAAAKAVGLLRELGKPVDIVTHGSAGGTESEEVLELVDDILRMAGMTGQDLVTVYA